MIQIYWTDNRDIILKYKDFNESYAFLNEITDFVKEGLMTKKVNKVVIKKWENLEGKK